HTTSQRDWSSDVCSSDLASRARDLGLDTLLLEAKNRIGGRCFTDTDSLGLPWDQGAHWMHQALSNPFVEFARERGHGWSERPREIGRAPGRERGGGGDAR